MKKALLFILFYILSIKTVLAQEEPLTITIVSLENQGDGTVDASFLVKNNTSNGSETALKFKIFQGGELKVFEFESIWVKWKGQRILYRSFDISNLNTKETASLQASATYTSKGASSSLSTNLKGFEVGPKQTITDFTDIRQIFLVLQQNISEAMISFFLFLGGILNGR